MSSIQSKIYFLVFCIIFSFKTFAHQTQTTIVLLDIKPGSVTMELQLSLSDLGLVFGKDMRHNTQTLAQPVKEELFGYLLWHIHVKNVNGNAWSLELQDVKVQNAVHGVDGAPFQEITIHLLLLPPAGSGTRRFTLDYDVIMHEVPTHTALVSIRNDWEGGNNEGLVSEVGVIKLDNVSGEILPMEINLEQGSWWKGFKSMVILGMQHIREGTDHLLFLLVLLLPATLLIAEKRWAGFGGTRYSIVRLLKITAAFTLGHSCTLLIGALDIFRLPAQPIEILIAVSIMVSAIHAIRPLFPGKEIYIAGGFGLIHGLAFASVLGNLKLSSGPMALSILGFNIGIELMQIFVILLIIPWLVLLSRTPFYKSIRVAGALLAVVASVAWIFERVSGSQNIVAKSMTDCSKYGYWLVLLLIAMTIGAYFFYRTQKDARPFSKVVV